MIQFYNTASRKKERFTVSDPARVTLYTCGPTVYNYLTIGNLRSYIFEDVLRRVLEYNGLPVEHVMNITDVGHLTSDADSGDDKIEKQARENRETAWDVAKKYTDAFQKNFRELNILTPHLYAKATDHIKEQIQLIQALEKKGFTYKTTDGVYFDSGRFPSYSAFARLDKDHLREGARVEKNKEKRHPTDFALWKFSPAGSQRDMEWESPWDKGFPGWHIECSAMSMKHLAPGTFTADGFHPEKFRTIDIHTGGIDHIPVHHTNEIAQSEAATGVRFVRFWLHGAFLTINEQRMGKSQGNMITLAILREKGFWPLIYRYLLLQTHYRSPMNFSWDAVDAARAGLYHIYSVFAGLPSSEGKPDSEHVLLFEEAINDDLNMPQALAVLWKVIKSGLSGGVKRATLLTFDRVFGLGLEQESERLQQSGLSEKAARTEKLLAERAQAREEKNFEQADALRQKIEKQGFEVRDTKEGTLLVPSMELWKP